MLNYLTFLSMDLINLMLFLLSKLYFFFNKFNPVFNKFNQDLVEQCFLLYLHQWSAKALHVYVHVFDVFSQILLFPLILTKMCFRNTVYLLTVFGNHYRSAHLSVRASFGWEQDH